MASAISLGIALLCASAIIFIGLKEPKKLLKHRHAFFISEIIGEEDTIKLFRFLGKLYLIFGIGVFVLAIFIYFYEL